MGGKVFEIAGFRLDTGQGTLAAGDRIVDLPPKAIALLAALAAAGGQLVSKSALLEAVWPDVVVEEGNLAKLVFLLRQHIGAGAIETVPKRGYRLGVEARPVAADPVVAVLPFRDLGAEQDLGHVCEGLSESIRAALARSAGVGVIARASTAQLARTASVLVEGSVRRSGTTLRVTVHLVDVDAGRERWSRSFERALGDLPALEDEIALAVARSLKPDATPARRRRPADFEAYELYLRGRYLWNRRPGEVVWRALECFERAVARDPSFAEAWAGMADVYSTLGSWEAGVLPHGEAQAKARAHAERALALEPALAEAHTTLAYTALHYSWDLTRAEAGFRRALADDPRYAAAHHWRAHALAAGARFDEALEASQTALSLDPMNILLAVHLAWHWHMARAPERVVEQAGRVVKMDPSFHWGHYFAGWGAEGLGDFAAAVDALARAVACSGGDPVMIAGHARALALAGDRARARELAADLVRRGAPHDLFAYELALIELGLGDADAALAWLARARAARSGWMVYAGVDPRLDPIRARL